MRVRIRIRIRSSIAATAVHSASVPPPEALYDKSCSTSPSAWSSETDLNLFPFAHVNFTFATRMNAKWTFLKYLVTLVFALMFIRTDDPSRSCLHVNHSSQMHLWHICHPPNHPFAFAFVFQTLIDPESTLFRFAWFSWRWYWAFARCWGLLEYWSC